MNTIQQQLLEGERALFQSRDLTVVDCKFANGESPLKESRDLRIEGTTFAWKYPLWYCDRVEVARSSLLETARSGIWYTNFITIRDSIIEAPKTFRRGHDITLQRVELPNAQETLWNCRNIRLEQVSAKGDYFGFNSSDIEIDGLRLAGNYCFDGGRNITVRNSHLLSKDSFWNCENVTVEDSTIIGEYIGWNSKNLTFINCTIESLQGLCYIEGLKLVNCKLLDTSLAFEYCSDVDAQVISRIDSVKNPISGTIRAKSIGEIIQDDPALDTTKVTITTEE